MKKSCLIRFIKWSGALVLLSALFLLVALIYKKGDYLSPSETAIVRYLKKIESIEETTGLPFVDCIYAINLDNRSDKWRVLQEECNRVGISVTRFPAINGWQLSEEARREMEGPYIRRVGPGHLGCLLSHFSVLRDAFQRGLEIVLVLEDDVHFLAPASDLSSLLEKVNQIDPEWDVLFTDADFRWPNGSVRAPEKRHIWPRPNQPIASRRSYVARQDCSHEIMRIHSRWGMHSYFVSKRGLKKIDDYFSHVHLWNHIDNDLLFVPGIRMYASKKDLTVQRGEHSSDTNNLNN